MKRFWRRAAILLASGGLTFQVDACTQASQLVTATSAAITAGGVVFIVNRIVND